MEIEKLLEFFDKNILERILEIYKSDWRSTINKINFDNAKKIILSFGMYIGLIKLLKKENISKREVSLIELENKAEDIYKQLGLEAQLALFNYEIEYNFGEKKPFYKIIPTNKFKFLSEYKKNDKNKTDIKSVEKIKKINEFKPRNYFAHAGFEINVTLVRGERNEIILKYDEEKINDIVNCVYKKI